MNVLRSMLVMMMFVMALINAAGAARADDGTAGATAAPTIRLATEAEIQSAAKAAKGEAADGMDWVVEPYNKADLRVTAATYGADTRRLRMTVKNFGAKMSGQFYVGIVVPGHSGVAYVVSNLHPNQHVSWYHQYNSALPHIGCQIKVTADSTNLVPEFNETNNIGFACSF